jgi:chlorite dismutase
MRFDHVSAVYALFGTFFVGLRCPADRLHELLEGKLPNHTPAGA